MPQLWQNYYKSRGTFIMNIRKLGELYVSFFKIGGLTFGGGLAMLPMLQREVVTDRKWCTEEEILDMYAIGQCTPGIIAVNTATFVGYYQKGIPGGIAATLGVVSPSVIIIGLIASLISNFAELAVVQHALKGINVAVCMLMIQAIAGLWKKSIKNIAAFCIFATALLLSLFTGLSTVWLVILSGALGILLSKAGWLKNE